MTAKIGPDNDQDEVMRYSSVCTFCIHLLSGPEQKCRAFPDGIPKEIWSGQNKHNKPFPGDHGIQFERLEPDRYNTL